MQLGNGKTSPSASNKQTKAKKKQTEKQTNQGKKKQTKKQTNQGKKETNQKQINQGKNKEHLTQELKKSSFSL